MEQRHSDRVSRQIPVPDDNVAIGGHWRGVGGAGWGGVWCSETESETGWGVACVAGVLGLGVVWRGVSVNAGRSADRPRPLIQCCSCPFSPRRMLFPGQPSPLAAN